MPNGTLMGINKIIGMNLGFMGRILSTSKSDYVRAHPGNAVLFNANIVVETNDGAMTKVWFGDIDLSMDERAIIGIAKDTDLKIYVFREMDARFEMENTPNPDKAVYWTDGDKTYLSVAYSRDEDGIIRYPA